MVLKKNQSFFNRQVFSIYSGVSDLVQCKYSSCYRAAISQFVKAYKLMGFAYNFQSDCDVYNPGDDKDKACRLARSYFKKGRKALKKAYEKKEKCDKM